MFQDILEQPQNIGGILEVWIALVDEVNSISRPVNRIVNSINFFSGGGWSEIEVLEDKSSFDQQTNEDVEGYSVQNIVSVATNKTRTEVDDIIDTILDQDLILAVKTNNSRLLLVGSREYPVRLTADSRTGGNYTDPNHYALRFEGDSIHLAYDLNPSIFPS